MKASQNLRNPVRYLLLTNLGSVAATSSTQADQLICTDSLQNGWQNWSWAAVGFNHATTIQSGAKSTGVIAWRRALS